MISMLSRFCEKSCLICGSKDNLNRISSSKNNIGFHICDECLKTIKIEKLESK